MWQIVVEQAWFMVSVYIALVLLRLFDLALKRSWPSASGALEFAIGKD